MLTVARGDKMHGCTLHNIPGQDNTRSDTMLCLTGLIIHSTNNWTFFSNCIQLKQYPIGLNGFWPVTNINIYVDIVIHTC